MFVELATGITVVSIFGVAKLKQDGHSGDDAKKIKQIADNNGLKKDGQSIIIRRRDPINRKKNKLYAEYVYQIPLGLSFDDFRDKFQKFEDGLNNKKTLISISLSDLKKINFKKLRSIKTWKGRMEYVQKTIKEKHLIRKSIDMSYDGMLRVKVYENGMPNKIDFNPDKWNECKGWQMPLGETREGTIFIDLAKGHFIVAGATTFGKSALLKLLISTLLHNKSEETLLTLVDLKGGLEMMYFEDCKQTVNFKDDLEGAVEVLRAIKEDIQKRQQYLREKKFNNVHKAGIKKRHFIIIDEASELAPSQVPSQYKDLAKEAQAYMSYITRIGHSMGYTLIYSTQYPVGDVMPNQIKANSQTTLCFRLETDTQSETVLDQTGAELIQYQGRCIHRTPAGRQLVQTYLIDDTTINKAVTPNIIIRPRKDEVHAKVCQEGTKDRCSIAVFEDTTLS
ncbi:FtsK/SpoIIIE domain-containing protein [Priestia flexa]|uniref:FtsK/SpoIIIE domain-containing protein n=1 Tax=Priestia flexa TaxID=86664 RepID=UPI00240D6BAF|nr:FtsK/SpoIIIE domain-containing protein [Priestia flexa]WEZ09597.1 FtsK/SpoIIIE domain-containing protein [Priestia flexa]